VKDRDFIILLLNTVFPSAFSLFTFLNVEGGYRRQEGANIDLTLWTVKSYIKFRRGLLSLKVGYEFEDENSWGDFRRDNYLYTEWKRKF